MWAAFGDARRLPPMAFALAAVFVRSSTLYNHMVYLLLKPNFLNVVTKDLSVFQTACAVICGSCRTPVKRVPCIHKDGRSSTKLASPFTENHGSCRSCVDAFECFSNYPRCCNLDHMDVNKAAGLSLVKTQVGNVASPSSVHLVVYTSTTRSTMETVEVTAGSLPPECMKDFL